MDLNNVTLTGHLKEKPQVTGEGDKAWAWTNLQVEVWANKQVETIAIPIMFSGKQAETIGKYGEEKKIIGIEGSLKVSSKGGTYVRVSRLKLLGKVFDKNQNSQSQSESPFNDDEIPF
jgi:single-stranded DNA-binding protein